MGAVWRREIKTQGDRDRETGQTGYTAVVETVPSMLRVVGRLQDLEKTRARSPWNLQKEHGPTHTYMKTVWPTKNSLNCVHSCLR